jgi:hypothetical protein
MSEEPFYTEAMAQEAGWEGDEAKYFATFMNACNKIVRQHDPIGRGIEDFPDWPWADFFTTTMTVEEVALCFLADMEEEFV